MITSILSATAFKVAILPLKAEDSASRYIQKFLTIRDLKLTFDKNPQYELIDMKNVARTYKEANIEDIFAMDKADLLEIGKELEADVVIRGSISSASAQRFSINIGMYSIRTDDLKSIKFEVEKDKKKRWSVLDKDFMGKLDSFISEEIEKINTLAVQDYHSDNFKDARSGFQTLLKYRPNNFKAYYYLGMIAYKQKSYNEAVSNFNTALSITPDDVLSLQTLSNVYRDMNNKEMMLTTLVKLGKIQNDEELWLSIANLYAENNQNDKAREALHEALKIDQDFIRGILRLAFLLYDEQKFNDAIPHLERASNEYPDNDLIAKKLAFAYQKTGRITEAIVRYENIVRTNPRNSLGYLNLAGLYRSAAAEAAESGNQNLANEYHQKALLTLNNLKKFDSENPLLYLRLSDIYLAMNNLGEAENSANSALSQDPTLYQPYMILATVNQRRGTEKYNQYVDIDKKYQTAVGRTADRLAKERETAKLAANNFFKKAEEQFKAAKTRTSEPEVIIDLNGKLANIAQLIKQTTKDF